MKLSDAASRLRACGIENPAYDAREIFRALGKIPSADLLFKDAEAPDELVAEAVERRCAREPLQYILGTVGFYREEYLVTPAVLIPREDTELLVDYAVSRLSECAEFLDLCTGSGCIALSVLHNTKSTSCSAVDLSEEALAVAKENARRLGLGTRVSFLCADVLKEIPALGEKKYHAILSNPPYVAEPVYRGLMPEIAFEPKTAFVGGEDGGDFYRAMIPLYRDRLRDGGFLAFEIGYDQSDLLLSLAERYRMTCEIHKDLSGNPRLAVLTPIG